VVGWLGRVLRGQRYGVWSMDLHPEAEVAAGMLRPGSPVVRVLRGLNALAYRGADFVVDLGPYMRRRIADGRRAARARRTRCTSGARRRGGADRAGREPPRARARPRGPLRRDVLGERRAWCTSSAPCSRRCGSSRRPARVLPLRRRRAAARADRGVRAGARAAELRLPRLLPARGAAPVALARGRAPRHAARRVRGDRGARPRSTARWRPPARCCSSAPRRASRRRR
jgi:hypothetical protein